MHGLYKLMVLVFRPHLQAPFAQVPKKDKVRAVALRITYNGRGRGSSNLIGTEWLSLPPQNSYFEAQTPKVMALRGGHL